MEKTKNEDGYKLVIGDLYFSLRVREEQAVSLLHQLNDAREEIESLKKQLATTDSELEDIETFSGDSLE